MGDGIIGGHRATLFTGGFEYLGAESFSCGGKDVVKGTLVGRYGGRYGAITGCHFSGGDADSGSALKISTGCRCASQDH